VNLPATPLKIGQVHALLRRDHPNLELSKIRYYEEMGLVAPARSRKGYRLYSEKDVACLREAIRLADEEFVPLRVIRVRLIEQGLLKDEHRISATPRQAARSTAGKVVSLPVSVLSAPNLVAVRSGDAPLESATDATIEERLSANQLLERSQIEPEALNRILALGLITAVTRDGEGTFDALDVRVVQSAAVLLRGGADPRLLGALRRVVERELGIVDGVTGELRATNTTPEEIVGVKLEVARDIEALRAALFEQALTQYINS
jgi:DNA-binding transcriptional MerR regulator